MTIFKGSGVALITPFKNGCVDWKSLKRLINWQLDNNTDSIISCGTTGEASTLEDSEHTEVVRKTVQIVGGKIPVIAGAGSNDTKHAVNMSKALADAGSDGLLIVTPYYNKCSEKGLIEHYIKIADSVKIPIILYSVPSRTGVNISPAVVKELYKHENIVGIKEASGNIAQVAAISEYASEDFALYSGNDDMIVPLMSLGGVGAISTAANIIPGDIHRLTEAYLTGNHKEALKLQQKIRPLVDALFMEVNPIPVKAALSIMNLTQMEYRLPLCKPSNKTLYELKCRMEEYGINIPTQLKSRPVKN